MGVKHDLALLDFSVFGKKTHDVVLGEARVDTSHEEVGTGVSSGIRDAAITTTVTTTVRRVGHIIASRTTIFALSTSAVVSNQQTVYAKNGKLETNRSPILPPGEALRLRSRLGGDSRLRGGDMERSSLAYWSRGSPSKMVVSYLCSKDASGLSSTAARCRTRQTFREKEMTRMSIYALRTLGVLQSTQSPGGDARIRDVKGRGGACIRRWSKVE